MDLWIRILACLLYAGIHLYIFGMLLPGFKKYPKQVHVPVVIIWALFYGFNDSSSLYHVLLLEFSTMVLIKAFYRTSTFVASLSTLIAYVISLMSSLISSNLMLLLTGDIIDFRAIYGAQNPLTLVLYGGVILSMMRYYRSYVNVFKKVAGAYSKFTWGIGIANMGMLVCVFAYQRITYSNVALFARDGLIHSPGTEHYKYYMLASYIFITVMGFLLILIINKMFIADISLESYKFKAETDLMTGALSREAGLTYLKGEMRKVALHGGELTIAYVDINNLKWVNDQWGHKEGDRLIQIICGIIRSKLRDTDIISRLGGDEFLIVFTQCSRTQAMRVWNRISEGFLKSNMELDTTYKISASAGVVQYNRQKHENLMALIHEADEAMYVQKKLAKTARL